MLQRVKCGVADVKKPGVNDTVVIMNNTDNSQTPKNS